MSIKTYHASTKKLEQLAGNVNPSDIEKLKNDVVQLNDEKTNQTDVYGSEEYNASTPYSVGDMCIYNGKLWKCLVACSGVEPTEGTYWTNINLNSLVNTIQNVITSISEIYSHNQSSSSAYEKYGEYTIPKTGWYVLTLIAWNAGYDVYGCYMTKPTSNSFLVAHDDTNNGEFGQVSCTVCQHLLKGEIIYLYAKTASGNSRIIRLSGICIAD